MFLICGLHSVVGGEMMSGPLGEVWNQIGVHSSEEFGSQPSRPSPWRV